MVDTTADTVSPTETAVIVPIPAAEVAVGEHRSRLDVAASWGVGAHVTVLYPFVHPHEVDQRLLERLTGAVRSKKAAEARVNGHLPLGAHIDRVAIIAGTSQPDSWRTIQELPLRPAQR